jgi:TatD DNase family protein
MKLFDTHAHYDDARFETEYEGGVDKLLQDCFDDCIGNIVNIGTSIKTSKISIELSEKYEQIYATIGIHPNECLQYESVDAVIDELRELSKHKRVVAIGEIGLDYHWDDVPRDVQMLYFEKQMALASELGLPVVIHDREAHGDCLEMIKKFPDVIGVFHSFSGSAEMAKELIKLGWYISFSGTLTFKNAKQPKEACKVVPDDRLLTETDAPYLPPVPHRGELNRSTYMYFTALEIANQRGVSIEEIEKITTENAKRVFRIK